MILRLILIFSLFSSNLLAQKKDYYYNQAKNQISETEYNKRIVSGAFKFKIETDTAYINIIESRKAYGKLSDSLFLELKQYLKEISNTNDEPSKIIVVNYYHGPDACNTSGSQTKSGYREWYKKYLRGFKRKKSISQYFVYLSKDGLGDQMSDIAIWHEDKNHKLKKTFFLFPYPCSSFVVVNSKGEYVVNRGEYGAEQVYSLVREVRFN